LGRLKKTPGRKITKTGIGGPCGLKDIAKKADKEGG